MEKYNYYKGLDGLRCIGMILITIAHIEWMKIRFGYDNYFSYFKQPAIGNASVTLFFVLSGFLITIVLLKEKLTTGTISVLQFYKRRIVRIWPLYYLIVLIGLLIFVNLPLLQHIWESENWKENKFAVWCIYLTHVPNIYFLFPKIPVIGQTWSIGVEEQFYLLWPILLKYPKKTLRVALVALFGVLLCKGAISIWSHDESKIEIFQNINRFLFLSRYECFIIGGLAAYMVVYKKENILQLLLKKWVQWSAYLIFLALFLSRAVDRGIDQLVYSILFSVMLLNISLNPQSLVKFEWKPMLYLGKISYGVYIFHPLVIISVLQVYSLNNCGKTIPLIDNMIIYLVVLALSISIAAFSFRYYEGFFQKIFKNVNRQHK